MLIKCPECERDISDTAPACPGCGYVLAPVSSAPPPAPAEPRGGLTTEQQILVEQRVTNEGPSMGVAYLLWLFLWWVSGHRFYLGKPGTALLQIASYFILVGFLWVLIDAFVIPDMVRQKRAELRTQLTALAALA
jgi:TM2 domain-containing membrane protein YozV